MMDKLSTYKKWYHADGNRHDVVISSRVRLARNLDAYPFMGKLDNAGSQKVVNDVTDALKAAYGETLVILDKNDINQNSRLLLEDHLISPEFCQNSPLEKALLLHESDNLAVMVGEEDHVRIQAIYPGFELDKAYESASKADDALSSKLALAFDEKLGYLTACPTNLGTGLRASVMLHLPAMCAYGYIKTLANLMAKIGLVVRGMYGEGSEAYGCLYQLSNQITLGISEKDALEKLRNAVNQIINKERELRETMVKNTSIDTADKLWRSYGTLKFARRLDTAEATKLLSNVRLATVCGIITDCKTINLTELLFSILPAHIVSRFPDANDPDKRDKYRADCIREVLA